MIKIIIKYSVSTRHFDVTGMKELVEYVMSMCWGWGWKGVREQRSIVEMLPYFVQEDRFEPILTFYFNKETYFNEPHEIIKKTNVMLCFW